jgi:hypothetical protein
MEEHPAAGRHVHQVSGEQVVAVLAYPGHVLELIVRESGVGTREQDVVGDRVADHRRDGYEREECEPDKNAELEQARRAVEPG